MKIGPTLTLFLLVLVPQGSFAQEPFFVSRSLSSVVGTYSVEQFNGNHSFLIKLQPRDESFITPRGYFYMGVGGNGLNPAGVSIWNSSGAKVGNTRATNGIIFFPHLPIGNYTVTTADVGSFLLAQDVQNSGDKFVGNVSEPIALLMVPFQRGAIHMEVQVSRPVDSYRVDLYNSSLGNIYSQEQAGASSFDFTPPSNGASIVYARISPDQPTVVQYTWTSSVGLTASTGLPLILFPVAAIVILGVFVVSRSKKRYNKLQRLST